MMKPEPTTTPQPTPRISGAVGATVISPEKPPELQETVLMHLSPPVLYQVSETSKQTTNPLVRDCTSNNPPEAKGRNKPSCLKEIPPPAHIPKPKAGSDPTRPQSIPSHTHPVPEVGRISKLYGYTMNNEPERASVMGEEQKFPWVSKLQVTWDNCVRNLTMSPFRKVRRAEKSSICDNTNQSPQFPQQVYGMEEQPSQECVASKIWWDLPVAMDRIRNRSSPSYPNNSSKQSDIIDKMMGFQQTQTYGPGKNIDTDVNVDGTAGPDLSTCLMTSLRVENSGNKVPQLPAANISKSGEHGRDQRLLPLQQKKVDGVPQGPHDSTIAHPSAITLKQEARNEIEQLRNNVHEANTTTVTRIEGQNMTKAEQDKIEDDSWVHQWLASYSAQQ